MNRSTLRLLTVVLGTGLAVVPFLGFDSLPRDLRSQIDSERSALTAAVSQVRSAQSEVSGELQSNADLFRSVPNSRQWAGELGSAQGILQSASREMDRLSLLEKQNRRGDRQAAEALLHQEQALRTGALTQASNVRRDAAHWVDLKRHLPDELQRMDRDYRTIHGFDLGPVTAAVQRAETDWPQKKADLDVRLASLRSLETETDAAWQSAAEARREAAAADFGRLDFSALSSAGDKLHTSATALPQKAGELQSLTGQLYDSWDKVLVDMEVRGQGNARAYDQQVRTIRTHVGGGTTSEEKWVDVSPATYKAMQNDLGMAIEHKPAGKYDYEAERVAQPAGFAYVAAPGQTNQYGYWDHHDGRDFWVFYGQYALMRDLLFNHSYRPLDRYEYEDYRGYQRTGRTYYGRDESASQAPKYGTKGTATQDRYSGSSYAQSGGFRDSQYASKSGGYRDSKFATPMARDPNADHSPHKFGSGSSGFAPPHAVPSRSAPSFHMPSAGRKFGRRR